jgi:cell division protein FtsN
MKNFFGKNFVIFLSLIAASCAPKNEQQSVIRIVDLQGKSHPVVTRVPDLNAQALVAQSRLSENQNNIPQNPAPSKPDLTQNTPNYGAIPPESAQKNFRSLTGAEKKLDDSAMLAASKEQTIEYDLSDPAEPKEPMVDKPAKKVVIFKSKKGAKPIASSAPKSTVVKSGKFAVQVGSFASPDSAEQTLAKMKKFHAGRVDAIEGDKTIYRVILGPFATKKQANDMVKKITNSGHDAILVRNK